MLCFSEAMLPTQPVPHVAYLQQAVALSSISNALRLQLLLHGLHITSNALLQQIQPQTKLLSPGS
jgi:hypothetical protein